MNEETSISLINRRLFASSADSLEGKDGFVCCVRVSSELCRSLVVIKEVGAFVLWYWCLAGEIKEFYA